WPSPDYDVEEHDSGADVFPSNSINPSTSDLTTMDCDVLTTEDCSGSEEEESSVESGMPPEFNTYWKAAMEKTNNFNAWTKLVAYAEQEKNLEACRKSYDAFLMYFPLCHIYWKKYAHVVQHLGNEEETEKIFCRAVKSNPLNVTLWIGYIQYLMKTMNMKLKESIDKLRGVYKEAVTASGMEFHSDELWKMNIDFEIQQNNLKEVTSLYDRLLSIPTQQYETQYERFKIFVASHSPFEILNTEEWDWIRSRVQLENDHYQISVEDSEDCVEPLTDSDVATFREHILRVREQLYLLNEEEVKKRWTFEEGVKRLYFCAAPINIKQLQNWRKYIEFEVSQGQHERIVFLFERCLMTCSLYEDFWLLYANYMEGHSVEAARSVFERACRIHLPQKYSIHLQWSAFEEKHGCLDSARAILCQLENVIPGLAIVRLRRVGLERRNGNLQEAERLLKEAAQISASTKMASFYAVKLSRLNLKLRKDPQKATAILNEALKKDPNNPILHMCMLEVEMSRDDGEGAPLVCMEHALNSKLPYLTKKILSERRLEFIEDFDSSLASWNHAYYDQQAMLKIKKGRKQKNNETDCYPPGVSPPPKDLKSEVSPANVSTVNSSMASSSVVSSSSNKSADTAIVLFPPISEPSPSSNYRSTRPLLHSPYFHHFRPYGPPQNVPIPALFRNRFPIPGENMYHDYHSSMNFNSHQIPFHGPHFMDNSGMPFRMPNLFDYGPWFQNFGAQNWNRFFPPQ
ncbi:pre-mRNA-processing factor 39-like, partial [Mantella aurantiaca]